MAHKRGAPNAQKLAGHSGQKKERSTFLPSTHLWTSCVVGYSRHALGYSEASSWPSTEPLVPDGDGESVPYSLLRPVANRRSYSHVPFVLRLGIARVSERGTPPLEGGVA